MISEKIKEILKPICKKLSNGGINWVLVGSANLGLQGVNVRVRDIDILTDKRGAFSINRLLKEYEVEKVRYTRSEKFASYFGKFKMGNTKIEVMGNLKLKDRSGKWWSGSYPLSNKRWIKLGKVRVPVSPLNYELIAYRRIGGYKKAKKIEEALRKSSKFSPS